LGVGRLLLLLPPKQEGLTGSADVSVEVRMTFPPITFVEDTAPTAGVLLLKGKGKEPLSETLHTD